MRNTKHDMQNKMRFWTNINQALCLLHLISIKLSIQGICESVSLGSFQFYSYLTRVNTIAKLLMSQLASQITSVSIVCWTVCSGTDQRKYQSSSLLAFVRGIHRWPVNSPHPHKGPLKRKMIPLDDVIVWLNGGGWCSNPNPTIRQTLPWSFMWDTHDNVIRWKHFPRYRPFVRGIQRGQRPVTRSFDVFFDL